MGVALQGGSAAYALLNGKDSMQSELDLGVGWQVSEPVSEWGSLHQA
jgi:hypothetical protein